LPVLGRPQIAGFQLSTEVEFSYLTLDAPGVTLSTQILPSNALTSLEFTTAVLHVRSAARLYLEYVTAIQ